MPAPHHRDCLMSMQAPQPNRRGRDAQAGRSGHSCETGVGRSAFERARVRAYSVATSSKVVLPTVKSGPLARLPWGGPRPRRPRSSVRPLARSRPHPRRPRLPRPRRRRRAVVTPPRSASSSRIPSRRRGWSGCGRGPRSTSAAASARTNSWLLCLLPRFNARLRVRPGAARTRRRSGRPDPPPRLHPQLPASPHGRPRPHRQVPPAHAPAAARTAANQLRLGARGGSGASQRRAHGPAPRRDDPPPPGSAARRGAADGSLRAGPEPGPRAHRRRARLRWSPRRLPAPAVAATVEVANNGGRGQTRDQRQAAPLPLPGSSRAGTRFSRPGYRACPCGQPPGCRESPG